MLFSELGRREIYLSKMLEHILQDVSSKLLFHGQATNGLDIFVSNCRGGGHRRYSPRSKSGRAA
jgi:hypothetical protein